MHIKILEDGIKSDIQWIEDHEGYGNTDAAAQANKEELKSDLTLWYLFKKFKKNTEAAQPEAMAMRVPDAGEKAALPNLLETADDELEDSEMYYEWYRETGEADFLGISRDELRHAEILIKSASMRGAAEEDIRERVQLHNVLLAKLA